MRVDDFDFQLPDTNIALRPAEPRDSAKMLVVNAKTDGGFGDSSVLELAQFLKRGDALVFNDTKVIPAQLEGIRRRGETSAKISATLHMKTEPDTWMAFVRGAKKIAVGETVEFGSSEFFAEVLSKSGSETEFRFNRSGPNLDAALVEYGSIPLPPYIASKRDEDTRDETDYQTVYARESGAVAAPTAGLHFTDKLFQSLDDAGISRHFVTLHVGAGTFLPVKVDDTNDHVMHSEIGTVTQETAKALNKIREQGGRIVCVGTTSLRLLESSASDDGTFNHWSGATDIFITPGYKFKAADVLMTNFHLPRSTLFMLVSAFAGGNAMKNAYQHAIKNDYRFYSYGDSSLLFPYND